MANKTLKITFVYWHFIKSNTTISRVKEQQVQQHRCSVIGWSVGETQGDFLQTAQGTSEPATLSEQNLVHSKDKSPKHKQNNVQRGAQSGERRADPHWGAQSAAPPAEGPTQAGQLLRAGPSSSPAFKGQQQDG